uniref:ABC transporter permease n=1 Tax=Clostridium sp. NkU-1 TaxID=1095009 RepID=UPI000B092340
MILLVICLFAAFLSESFLSVSNLFNVFKQVTVAGIIGCGMTFVILTGGIDLSVGSILGFAGVVASGVLASTGNTFLAVLTAVAIGITCGIVNGFFYFSVRDSPIYCNPWNDDPASGLRFGLHQRFSHSGQGRFL